MCFPYAFCYLIYFAHIKHYCSVKLLQIECNNREKLLNKNVSLKKRKRNAYKNISQQHNLYDYMNTFEKKK